MPTQHDKSTGQFTSGKQVARILKGHHGESLRRLAKQGENLKSQITDPAPSMGAPKGWESSSHTAHRRYVSELHKAVRNNPSNKAVKHLLAHHQDVAEQHYGSKKMSSIDGDEAVVSFILDRKGRYNG